LDRAGKNDKSTRAVEVEQMNTKDEIEITYSDRELSLCLPVLLL
jgi:hypothetical protein